jgi:hypothetical protein
MDHQNLLFLTGETISSTSLNSKLFIYKIFCDNYLSVVNQVIYVYLSGIYKVIY